MAPGQQPLETVYLNRVLATICEACDFRGQLIAAPLKLHNDSSCMVLFLIISAVN